MPKVILAYSPQRQLHNNVRLHVPAWSLLFFIKFCYINNMGNCIFCKIAEGEIPCDKVYEDKNFLVFLDIKPVSHGHILIIPKEHIVWMEEADDEIISKIFILTKRIMIAMKKGLECKYVQVAVAGDEVPHFHIHIFPRYHKDNLLEFPRKEYQKGQEKEIIQKITQAL